MRKLNHPNIIKLFNVYETENTILLVMQWIRGDSLL